MVTCEYLGWSTLDQLDIYSRTDPRAQLVRSSNSRRTSG